MHNFKRFSFFMPGETWIGFSAVEELGRSLIKKRVDRGLIVTDEFMAGSKVTAKVVEVLKESGIETFIYSGVKPDPTTDQVSEAAIEFKKNHCNALISIGGGSPHDCAKAVKYLLVRGGVCEKDKVILAAVNTTAGTGSELTKFAVITDPENQTKTPIVDEIIIPDIAVDDTTLMMDMPKGLTAATGIDAMAHAIEAFVSTERNYIIGCTAMEAMRLVDKYLVMAYNQGDNVEARDGMAYAQYLAGMAFSNAGLGIVHAMAHQLGATYHLPHGVSNAMLLPSCIRYNAAKGCDLYGEIGRELKLFHGNFSPEIAGEKFAGYIARLNKEIGIPANLKEAGVKPEDFREMAEKALQDVCMETNPAAPTLEDVIGVYEAAYKGTTLR